MFIGGFLVFESLQKAPLGGCWNVYFEPPKKQKQPKIPPGKKAIHKKGQRQGDARALRKEAEPKDICEELCEDLRGDEAKPFDALGERSFLGWEAWFLYVFVF